MKTVLIAGIVVMLVKFTAYFITHSNAILSDAMESIINVTAGAFAYYSLRLAAKPKDPGHPYGHGKIEFISAGFEGGLIFIAGIIIITKSVMNLLHPGVVESLDIGAILAAGAGVINFILGRYLINTGTKHKSITLVADGKHLLSDTWSSAGLIVGVLIIYVTGLVWLDSVFAIIFGGIIIFTGYKLVRKSLAGLMDEADENILQEVVTVLNNNRQTAWIDIHNLRIQQYGSSYHIDCHMTLPWYNSLQESHESVKQLEQLIAEKFHERVELFIHPDPCLPFSCAVCQIASCPHRTTAMQQKLDWTLENLLADAKHSSTLHPN